MVDVDGWSLTPESGRESKMSISRPSAGPLFIIHSSKDGDTVAALAGVLEARGVVCRYAPRDFGSGPTWAAQCVRDITNAAAVLILVSQHSVESVHVLNELTVASNAQKQIIVVVAGEPAVSPEFEFHLSRLHWLSLDPPSFDGTASKVEQLLSQSEAPAGAMIGPDSIRGLKARTPVWRYSLTVAAVVLVPCLAWLAWSQWQAQALKDRDLGSASQLVYAGIKRKALAELEKFRQLAKPTDCPKTSADLKLIETEAQRLELAGNLTAAKQAYEMLHGQAMLGWSLLHTQQSSAVNFLAQAEGLQSRLEAQAEAIKAQQPSRQSATLSSAVQLLEKSRGLLNNRQIQEATGVLLEAQALLVPMMVGGSKSGQRQQAWEQDVAKRIASANKKFIGEVPQSVETLCP